MSTTLRIYRLKLLIMGATLLVFGLLATMLGDWLDAQQADHLFVAVVQALADVLVVTGGFGIAIDFFTGRDRDAASLEAARTTLKELTPDFTDAVLKGLAVDKSDLERVASPELLDSIATNALSLRLGDDQFAQEIYTDLRDQAIRAAERWTDVNVNIRLSTAVERSAGGTPLFDVLVEWEYSATLSHAVRRFACVSDREDYEELVTDVPATSTWFMTKRPGLEASSRETYELLYFIVDGEERSIRRQQRKDGQTYTVTIGEDIVHQEQPVRIKHLYRVRISQAAQYLFIDLPQPTKNLSLRLDYTDSSIDRLSVLDLVTSTKRPEIVPSPEQVDARIVSVDLPGWLLPRAGFTFIWSLVSDVRPTAATGRATAQPGSSSRRPAA